MAIFSELQSSLALDSSDFKRGLKSASGTAASFSSTVSSAFNDVDDEASEAARSSNRLSDAMDDTGSSAAKAIIPLRGASSSMDSVGDNAAGASPKLGLLTTSLFGMGTASALASVSVTGLATSLAGLVGIVGIAVAVLAPLAAGAALASGAILGLAAAFGAIMGSGLLAFNQKTKGLKKTLADLQSELKPLIVSFGSQFIPLIRDGLNAIVPFVKALLDAAGNLSPFVSALRALGGAAFEIIPKMLELFVNVARTALPAFTKLGNFIAANFIPTLRALMQAGRKAAAPVARFGMAAFEAGKKLAPLAGWLGKIGMALYDLAAAALGVGKLTTALQRFGTIAKQGIIAARDAIVMGVVDILTSFNLLPNSVAMAISDVVNIITSGVSAILLSLLGFGKKAKEQWGYAMVSLELLTLTYIPRIVSFLTKKIQQGIKLVWGWVKTKGVKLAKQALRLLAKGAIAAFKFGKNKLLPAIRKGVRAAWNWVRTKGVALGKKALGFLASQALNALKFGREQIVPKIKTGLGKAWGWIRTKGVTLGKKALGFLAKQILNALKFAREDIVPKVKKGLGNAWEWIRTKGKTKGKKALKFLSKKAAEGLNTFETKVLPKIKKGIQGGAKWIRTKGKNKLKKALQKAGNLATKTFKFGKTQLVPKIKKGMKKAGQWIRTKGFSLFKKAFRTLGRNLGPALMTYFGTQLNVFKKTLPKIADWLRNNGDKILVKGFKAIGRGIRKFFMGAFAIGGLIGTAIGEGIVGLQQWLSSGGLTKMVNGFKDIVGGITKYLKNQAWSDLKGAAEFLFTAPIDASTALINGLLGTDGIFKKLIGDIVSYIKNDATDDVVGAFEALGRGIEGAFKSAAKWAIDAFNGLLPNQLKLPTMKIPKVSITAPNVPGIKELSGQEIGAGPWTFGGQSFSIPQLAVGGEINSDGWYYGHAGETVVPAGVDTPYQGDSSGGSGSQNVNVTLSVEGDSELADMIQRNIAANEKEKDRSIDRARSSFGAGGG
jgi:hypothetical protein